MGYTSNYYSPIEIEENAKKVKTRSFVKINKTKHISLGNVILRIQWDCGLKLYGKK